MPVNASSSITQSGSWRLTRAIGLLALAGLLLWQLVTKEVAYYLALEAPETALRLRPTEPTALISLADQQLNFRQAKPGRTENAQTAAVDHGAEPGEQTRDRLGGWAELGLKAAVSRLPVDAPPQVMDAIVTAKLRGVGPQ